MRARTSTWRRQYKVHPFADEFDMLTGAALAAFVQDIKENKLTSQVSFFFSERLVGAPCIEYVKANGVLADGRNRMEALELLGLELTPCAIEVVNINEVDPVVFILSRNVHRRHLTKQQQAALIVAAHRATPVSRQDGGKLAEGRPVNQVKAAAVASAKALPNPISERTIERAMAKAEGREPKQRQLSDHQRDQLDRRNFAKSHPVDHALTLVKRMTPGQRNQFDVDYTVWCERTGQRRTKLNQLAKVIGLIASPNGFERTSAIETANRLLEPMGLELVVKRPSTLPQDDRSEVPVDDLGQLVDDLLLGDIPECRDRRKRP